MDDISHDVLFLRKKNISKLIKSKNAAASYVSQNYRKINISDNRISLKNELEPYVEKRGPKYSGRIMGSNDVDPASKPYIQLHDLEVKDPMKWSSAMAKLINDTNASSDGNMVV